MASALDDLVGCLALTEVEPGVLEGANLDLDYRRVFAQEAMIREI